MMQAKGTVRGYMYAMKDTNADSVTVVYQVPKRLSASKPAATNRFHNRRSHIQGVRNDASPEVHAGPRRGREFQGCR